MSSDESKIEIRKLTESDLPEVLEIERRSFPAPWSTEHFARERSKTWGIWLVAVIGDELVGYLFCSPYEQIWHLEKFAVSPKHRRRGVGTQLMGRLLSDAVAVLPLTLNVEASNHGAIEFY